jgi:hypothetical protein
VIADGVPFDPQDRDEPHAQTAWAKVQDVNET